MRHNSSFEACLIGFTLKNTVSEIGKVTRGICAVRNNTLNSIQEVSNIGYDDGILTSDIGYLDPDCAVSMNMWGFHRGFMEVVEKEFSYFLNNLKDPMKEEYLIPKLVGRLLSDNNINVKIFNSDEQWIGITYKEDLEKARQEIGKLIREGLY